MFRLNKYGKLEMDTILFEASYPILFTCSNSQNELFICVCCQNNEKGRKWLLTKTDEELIIQMLNDEITIREVFLRYPECRISVFVGDNYVVKEHAEEDWGESSIYLPKEGEYMEADLGEFDEEINYFKEKTRKKEKSESLYTIPFDAGNILADTLNVFVEISSDVPEVTGKLVDSYVCETFNVVDGLYLEHSKDMLLTSYAVSNIVQQPETIVILSSGNELEKHICHIDEKDSMNMAA